ncbi:YecA family protein [Actinomadura hibisca]|uniref:YecA family protein n=1 Tax=Actinomadura hibisca TaxID=68565 RepID=UPI00082B5F4D|nr:SEC-C domain-containing protein [Actinomadura hibisca]
MCYVASDTAGDKAERRTRDVAALLGVADFVYAQPVVHERSSNNEVGDGLLIVGQLGAVLQVKARDPEIGLRDSEAKAERVVRKFIDVAARQGSGSKRTIQKYQGWGQPLQALPVRAFEFAGDLRRDFALDLSMDCGLWPTIVVVDHPADPQFEVDSPPGVFCISLSDWEWLLWQIRSVSGLLYYVERTLAAGLPTVFGAEHLRFSLVCQADSASSAHSSRAQPWFSTAAVEDPVGVDLYRDLIAKLWHGQSQHGKPLVPAEIRTIAAFLDDAPTAHQATIGRWVLSKRSELDETGQTGSGNAVFNDRLFVYMCGTSRTWPDHGAWEAELGTLTLVRLLHWRESRGGSTTALGIGVREVDGGVAYTYVYVSEPVNVPSDIRAHIEWNYGITNLAHGHTYLPKPGRNDPCPCGGGTKYKRCHGAPGKPTPTT